MELERIDIKNYIYWLDNQDTDCLILDLKELDDYHILEAILYAFSIFEKQELKSVRCLIDVTNLDASFNTHFTLRKFSKKMVKYVLKASIVGVEGFLVPLHKAYAAFTGSVAVLHKTKEEGLKYIRS